MRDKQTRKKGRTWAEAAKTVLEKYPNTPMSHKEILQVIQREGLKEISGTSPLACLNAMLHTNSRGEQGIFYKVPGRMGVYTLKQKDVSDSPKELSEDGSEESSDVVSDSQSTENSNNANSKDSRRGTWRRRAVWCVSKEDLYQRRRLTMPSRQEAPTRLSMTSKLQSQPSSPQSRCTSPSVPASKLISPSQKHSKKALKQALKQQQQRNQRRQGGIPSSSSSSRLVLKTIKDMADPATATKTAAWEMKQAAQRSTSPQNSSSSSSSSSSVKADLCPSVSTRKMSQRSDRLSARQLKRTKCAEIDVETPDSILVNTNLRALINKHTLSALPQDCQQRLLSLLPEVDRQTCVDGQLKLSSSALNNEFFTSAAQSWKERLAEGEFTPEMRLRIRQELEKEKKMEQWKEHFFESYYGQNSGLSIEESKEMMEAVPHLEPSKHTPPPLPQQTGDARGRAGDCARPAGIPSTAATPEVSSPKPEEKTALVRSEQATHEGVQLEKGSRGEGGAEGKSETTSSQTPGGEALGPEHMEVAPESLKRKSVSEEEVAPSPSKRPRVVESPLLPQTPPPRASPEVKDWTAAPRVPPLKIPVSRILSAPGAAGGQVSPRSPFPAPLPSPGRTGARTLADIKAKAQLARAQRAAAAAAAAAASVSTAGGAVPGPGPGGGPLSPSPGPQPGTSFIWAGSSGAQLQPAARSAVGRRESAPPAMVTAAMPTPSSANPPASRVDPSSSQVSGLTRAHPSDPAAGGQSEKPSPEQTNPANSAAGKTGSPTTSKLSTPSMLPGRQQVALPPQGTSATSPCPATHPPPAPALTQRKPESPQAVGSAAKMSSSITTSNPLVTKLLQGKEVPLEQILPRALAKAQPTATPTGERRTFSGTPLHSESPAGPQDKPRHHPAPAP
ncbi:hypothetical protein AAFF_G00088120 [Aldrovandia affinis]|uniref:Polycomb group protein ASXL2 n=1 Tax=Aldrovandia affinis TaxID=143900 RepID=A0AAD7RWE3_9TELE|nr:hypothetical protein AAFF_G00088120 [Aldrovandia affinis]